jgi:Lambda phage tail tube protein, TTP
MATSANLSKGIEFKRGSGTSPETFTTLFEVTEIGDFGFESPLEDATHFQSTFMEYILGMPDGLEFPVTCNWVPTNATQWAMKQDAFNAATRNFKMVFPAALGGVQFSFSALVRGFRSPQTPTAIAKITFTLKITGAITMQDL